MCTISLENPVEMIMKLPLSDSNNESLINLFAHTHTNKGRGARRNVVINKVSFA